MPQERTLIYAGREFEVEHVRSHTHGHHEWSAPYVMASQRIVFPISRAMLDLRFGNCTWLVDGLTAISFGDATVYQLRPGARATRRSVVVSGHQRVSGDSEPAVCFLSPKLLYRVHAAQQQLRSGSDDAACIASLVGELRSARSLMPLTEPIASARRLLAETADRHAGPSLHEVADAVSRSPFHMARSFRKQTGLSLHQYRQHLRLAAAMERLVDGDRDLAGIAHDLGYCSQSHLGAVFKQEVGVTLGEARRMLDSSARI
ncbi:AraC-like DNA-binding protein [Variovorax boronicumulans]|uniref:AraC-like DNA-binding protein n=1 Tax=Variovorax boronicumulans TaxID=436515 RepID=A0AAW8CVV7_9BURK|nr:AraC family transcriptional regulator [Variovorax boronicumulans]MDP9892673.1 AraC-like DNA-binding protein [Variovorax boronicumulans]MDQ0051846.1 AraC-like DNA-binding protein [Variovorax boronicumulans]